MLHTSTFKILTICACSIVVLLGGTVLALAVPAFADEPEKDIAKLLEAPANLEFEDVPLNEILETVKHQLKIAIEIDLPALAKEEVDPATPITICVGEIPLRDALQLMLEPLTLKAVVREKALVITTSK